MVRPSCYEKPNLRKGTWNEEEDVEMVAFVTKQGANNWQVGVPKKPGLKRCGKSCRVRKSNVMRSDHFRQESFNAQEEELIIKLHSAIGSRWPIIAQQLPGRTENDVKNYWNTKLKKKLSSMGIDPVTHRPFSQMLADYGNISGLTRTQQTLKTSPQTTFVNFNNNNNVKLEPIEMVKADSFDLLSQLQAITQVKDTSSNHEIVSSSSSSSCSTLTPQQNFNWRDFLIENAQEHEDYGVKVNDQKLDFEEVGGLESIMGVTPLMNGFKETEEACDGSFVEAMLDGENDMLLDFPGLLGEQSYY